MSFGKMNTFIQIEEKNTGEDSAGFSTDDTYNVLASVRAYKEERHGSERWANMAAFSTASALFRFRKIRTLELTTKHFIFDGENRYNIVSADNVRQRGMYVEVLAEREQKGTVK